MSRIISEQIEKTQNLLTGLRSKTELLRNKGIDEEFLSKLSDNNELVAVYNEEIDKLKAELRQKTILANRKMEEVKAQIRVAKKVVKKDYPQVQWREFGIIDKR